MSDSSILDRNLVALSAHCHQLASRISLVSGNPGLDFVTARTGLPIPVLMRNGHPFPMHSRFDPEAEGRRFAEEAPSGYLISFGLGGAYHLVPLLKKKSLTGLIIVEKDVSLVRRILETIDMTRLFSDTRVILLVDVSPDELTRIVLDRYLPVLYGNLGSISLRTRWDSEPQWFADRAKTLRGLPEALGRDYTVQSQFGRRWLVHTIANLERSEQVLCALPPVKKLLITAAGPSIQDQLPRLRQLKKDGATLLATDTSLPVLSAAGIPPDIVLSIDCQVISYHHFLRGLPKETALILDLASPPLLTRLTDRILFYSSGHPFSLYLNQLYRPFPIIDISGGNVTHAAISFAQVAGAAEVRLFGGDFSYPNGRPYAQSSYIFPYFQSRSTRTAGSESCFWEFVTNHQPRREKTRHGWRWRTKTMDYYREVLEKAVSTMSCRVILETGRGVPIRVSRNDSPASVSSRITSILSAGPIKSGWRDFLADYRNSLESLPPLSGPPQDYLEGLAPKSRQTWATLLPSAATFQNGLQDGPMAVEKARLWTLERIKGVLARSFHSQTNPP